MRVLMNDSRALSEWRALMIMKADDQRALILMVCSIKGDEHQKGLFRQVFPTGTSQGMDPLWDPSGI